MERKSGGLVVNGLYSLSLKKDASPYLKPLEPGEFDECPLNTECHKDWCPTSIR